MRRKRALGFTLIELAVVILLISIFMGLGLSALDVQQTNRAFSETREKQEKIKDALVTYLANYRRLPCPDTKPTGGPPAPPNGVENRVGGVPTNPANPCSNPGGAPINPIFGVIPYATLRLSRDDALDGWDNFFSYQVSLDNLATPAPVNEEWSLTNAFLVGNEGSITLNDRDAAGALIPLSNPPPAAGPVPRGIAAVIVSHGRNGSGAFTTKGTQNLAPTASDELENTDADSVFFQREFTDVVVPGGGPFDDLVLALTPTDLLTPAIKDGSLPSATAQTLSQVKTIADTAFGAVPIDPPGLPEACFPPPNLGAIALPADVKVDPWGQTINYWADTRRLTPTTPDSGDAFCIWSSGPNRSSDTTSPSFPGTCPVIFGDDIALIRVSYEQLRAAFSAGITPTQPCPPSP